MVQNGRSALVPTRCADRFALVNQRQLHLRRNNTISVMGPVYDFQTLEECIAIVHEEQSRMLLVVHWYTERSVIIT
jgi:hypothetical protein